MDQNDDSAQSNSISKKAIVTQIQAQINLNENIVETNFSDINGMYHPLERSNKPFEGIFSTNDEEKNESKESNQIENKNQENENKEKKEIDFRFLQLNEILCKNCKKPFEFDINFKNCKYINAECQCKKIINKQIKNFLQRI